MGNTTTQCLGCDYVYPSPYSFGHFCAKDGSNYLRVQYKDHACENPDSSKTPQRFETSARNDHRSCSYQGHCSATEPVKYCAQKTERGVPTCTCAKAGQPAPCDLKCCLTSGGAGSEGIIASETWSEYPSVS